jgi:short-subunit dehydrogenase
VEALPAQVIAQRGVVDGLVHCAGIIQPFAKLQDLEYGAIERVFAVNWWGTLYLNKTFLPQLLARPEGHIDNVASMGGFLPVPGQTTTAPRRPRSSS